jgi:hypothetical protein
MKVFAELRGVDILVSVVPENPKPYEDVTIVIDSYSADLNSAIIEWRSGEKVLLKDTGIKDFSFKMGALNTKSVIDIKITTPAGETVQKRIILEPADMDILWQATNSYVPPFYRGKALPPKEGEVRVIAIPTGSKGIQANNATYIWKLNSQTQQDQSGYKKNNFLFDLSSSGSLDTVEVASTPTAGGSVSTGQLKISGINPQILFYKKLGNEGILYNKNLSQEFFLEESEITLVAEPYFMGNTQSNTNEYEWKLNGEIIPTPAKRNMLTIRPTSRGGYAKVNLMIENTLKLFQSAKQELKINL